MSQASVRRKQFHQPVETAEPALLVAHPRRLAGDALMRHHDVGGIAARLEASGINVELVLGKRIVQAWRAGNWPEGIHFIVRFELAAGNGTKLTLDHAGAPNGSEEMLEGGWHKMHGEPLAKHLG